MKSAKVHKVIVYFKSPDRKWPERTWHMKEECLSKGLCYLCTIFILDFFLLFC